MPGRKTVLALVALSAFGAVTWALFGWHTIETEAQGLVTTKRWFGKSLKVAVDIDRDGRLDAVAHYTWKHPYEGLLNGPCVYPGQRLVEDRNHDGRWDTWSIDRCDTPDLARYVLKADTTGDGRADLEISTDDSYSAYEEIKQTRGY